MDLTAKPSDATLIGFLTQFDVTLIASDVFSSCSRPANSFISPTTNLSPLYCDADATGQCVGSKKLNN